jgi:hypothetical protein
VAGSLKVAPSQTYNVAALRLGMGMPSLFLPYFRRNAAGHTDLELSIPRRGIILIAPGVNPGISISGKIKRCKQCKLRER